jgi:hypothetical protein
MYFEALNLNEDIVILIINRNLAGDNRAELFFINLSLDELRVFTVYLSLPN